MRETSKASGQSFACQECGAPFTVSDEVLAKYPGWKPKTCFPCKSGKGQGRTGAPTPSGRGAARPGSGSREENLSLAAVLARHTAGPLEGVFTDGAADPNPGPGGWGAVHVVGNRVVSEDCGHEPHTTNNRMELFALVAGCRLVPAGTPTILYTDSMLCVNTLTKWAKGWEARGWRRKDGPIKNHELVQQLYATLRSRPELEVRWIAAHSGIRWNEYADSLATAYRRKVR